MTEYLTYQERDLMMSAVLAYAEKQNENKVLGYAFAFGMMKTILTDQQVRDLFRMTHE